MLNSLMRTVVPAIYLLLIHLGLAHGIAQPWELDVISVVVLAAVYLLLRVLEQRWRVIGLLLGWIGAPSYDQPAHDAVDQAQTAARDELATLLQSVARGIVNQVEYRVNSIVRDHTSRQTSELTKAISPKRASSSRIAEAPAKKAAAPVKKATARKPRGAAGGKE